MLYGVAPFDPLTFALAAAALLFAALWAMVVPAMRASRVDPAVTLRS
jgi:ABC-type lipoprotein release transport system permease subunit